MNRGMVIAGAGLAGLTVAETLRAEGYDGPITLLGDEPHAPYHRPPLSKDYLLGKTQEAQLLIRAPEALAKKRIAFVPGSGVIAIDRLARRVRLTDCRTLDYEGLALCTGARPRQINTPGMQASGVFALRTLDDSRLLAEVLQHSRNVAVIGGGFIGLEVAAVARALGKNVAVLEAAERLMARAVSPFISSYYLALHRGRGVNVVLGAQISEFTVADGNVAAVRTTDGQTFPADIVIVGIGVFPNVEAAQKAGLECSGGIVVDTLSRTADPVIVAAGDCTIRRLEEGSLRRLESVQNAVEQAKSAAASLLSKSRPNTASPWFWSEQYGVKLQMAGLCAGFDDMHVQGDPARHAFSVFHFRGGRLIAVDSVNQPAEHMAARRLLDAHPAPSRQELVEAGFNLPLLLTAKKGTTPMAAAPTTA